MDSPHTEAPPSSQLRYVSWDVQVYAAVTDENLEEIQKKVTKGLTQITATLSGHQPAVTAVGPHTEIENLSEPT